MSRESATVIGALIVALGIIGASALVTRSIDSASRELDRLGDSLAQRDAAAPPSAKRRPSRHGPDPEKVYSVEIGDAPTKGPRNAPITLIEFSDFQCPFCGRASTTIAQVEKEYGDRVRLVFKHYPLSIHPKSPEAHAAAEAARAQGHFWEMHDLIFAHQHEMGLPKYLEFAGSLGLDIERFKKDMDSAAIKKRIDADIAQATKLGITGTPGFFLNGRYFAGARPFEEFKRRIDEAL